MDESRKTNHRPLPSWRAMHADTPSWAEKMQLTFFRDAPSWRKLEMAADLTEGMLQLAESGLADRHPNSSPDAIRRHLADLILGPEIAAKVYGPRTDADDQEK